MYESILVATDGSDTAERAVDHAVFLAETLAVPLFAISVLEDRTAYDSGIVDPEEVRERQRSRADDALERVEAAAGESGVHVTTARKRGTPHEEVLDYADEQGCSMIVVGAQGRSAFREALLGSTVDALVRLSSKPVLVVGDDGPDRVSP
ncbi:universal stress protein [Natronosalvus halobius]|uniref:universal stress protein n=1 Tax=Natronosalvus halobius TaxID=2953746 RepID=UPI00209D3D82|nr:universal stress protein [Natronosalvus halobius]USZ71647.1 universal stress protein [Natronosalvus halobius]